MCTWQGCNRDAGYPQVSADGETWANLCGAHAWDLEDAIEFGSPGKKLSAWIKAQGGPKSAAQRLTK